MAERLAELGADVAIHDLDWSQPAKYGESPTSARSSRRSSGTARRVAAVTGNIGDPEAVARDEGRDRGRSSARCEILVNCAGGDIGASGGKPSPNNALDIPSRTSGC